MRLTCAIAILTVVTALDVPVTASAQAPVRFNFRVSSVKFDGAQTHSASKGEPLADIDIAMPFAVQLDGDVPANIEKKVHGDRNAPMVAGKIMLSSGGSTITYCGPGKFGLLGSAPCLLDKDSDGKFDMAAKALDTQAHPVGILAMGQTLLGVQLAAPEYLPTPVPYHRVEGIQGPLSRGQLIWDSDYKSDRPGPVRIALCYKAMRYAVGSELYSDAREVLFDGTPVDVDLDGIKVTILNIEGGRLSYRLFGGLDAAPLVMAYHDYPFQLTIYLP